MIFFPFFMPIGGGGGGGGHLNKKDKVLFVWLAISGALFIIAWVLFAAGALITNEFALWRSIPFAVCGVNFLASIFGFIGSLVYDMVTYSENPE